MVMEFLVAGWVQVASCEHLLKFDDLPDYPCYGCSMELDGYYSDGVAFNADCCSNRI